MEGYLTVWELLAVFGMMGSVLVLITLVPYYILYGKRP